MNLTTDSGHRDGAEWQGKVLKCDSLQCDDSSEVVRSIDGPTGPGVVGESVAEDVGCPIKVIEVRKSCHRLHALHRARASADDPDRYSHAPLSFNPSEFRQLVQGIDARIGFRANAILLTSDLIEVTADVWQSSGVGCLSRTECSWAVSM